MAPRTLVTVLIAAGVLLIVLWLAPRLPQTKTETPTPAATPAESPPSPSPTASPIRILQRLAGTVVGDVRYAVVEQPDGTSSLYRPGDEVAGLGQLVAIEADHATFLTPSGPVELRLAPAATGTPAPTRRPIPPTQLRPATPMRSRRPAGTQSESSP